MTQTQTTTAAATEMTPDELALSVFLDELFPLTPDAEPVTAASAGYIPPMSDAEPCSPEEFAAWSAPWIEWSRQAEDAKLARKGGRRLTAEEIAARLAHSKALTASLAARSGDPAGASGPRLSYLRRQADRHARRSARSTWSGPLRPALRDVPR